jgi:hypothetical protein
MVGQGNHMRKLFTIFMFIISLTAGMMMGAFIGEIMYQSGVWDALDERAYTADE